LITKSKSRREEQVLTGDWYQWEGEGDRESLCMNTVQILHTHIYKWENNTIETIPGMGGDNKG
jgi:hypothetical protein